MASLAAALAMPVNWPESTRTPSSSYAAVRLSALSSCPGGWITTWMGKSYFWANSKSRWSWAGTAITAPVPYSMSTKLAT